MKILAAKPIVLYAGKPEYEGDKST